MASHQCTYRCHASWLSCQLRANNTGGVYVCKVYWDSQLGEDLHQAGWKADMLDGKLFELVEAP